MSMAKSATTGKPKRTIPKKAAAKKPAQRKAKAPARKKTVGAKPKNGGGSKLKAAVHVALYCDKSGNILQQEMITSAIRSARKIVEQQIPDRPPVGDDEGGGCPPGKFPCRRADGTMGCCG
jgi:hypothetical protein